MEFYSVKMHRGNKVEKSFSLIGFAKDDLLKDCPRFWFDVYWGNKKVEIDTYNFRISLNWSKICMNAPISELGVVAKCQ